MLPNVLLIIVNVSSHDFYYLCNLPFQLVGVLVILILEFHMSPFLFCSWPHSVNVIVISTLTCVLWTFSLTIFYRKRFITSAIMCCHCAVFQLPLLTDLLYQFSPVSLVS